MALAYDFECSTNIKRVTYFLYRIRYDTNVTYTVRKHLSFYLMYIPVLDSQQSTYFLLEPVSPCRNWQYIAKTRDQTGAGVFSIHKLVCILGISKVFWIKYLLEKKCDSEDAMWKSSNVNLFVKSLCITYNQSAVATISEELHVNAVADGIGTCG